jgi:glycosyltransferase involved in cell wall biosynthesis
LPQLAEMHERAEAQNSATTSLLIEGWRGVNHSYALVNQYQILELSRMGRLRLFHHDLPFFNANWNRKDNNAGFPTAAQQKIDALPPAGDARIDCVYRIASPFVAGAVDDERRTLTYMITELGLAGADIAAEPSRYALFTRGENAIVTPTQWSKERIVEFGFPEEKIRIVPHAVDTTLFKPVSVAEGAASRVGLGIQEDETVFVNVGSAFWNKGIDLLLRAFAELRQRQRRVRLIIKDQRGLYGVSLEQTLGNIAKEYPSVLHADTLGAISVISGNLGRPELRMLYGIADCYVSPYRAEGFNLPVLEAIACGTPVIVTQGGATDGFCPEDVAWRIPGVLCSADNLGFGRAGRYIEPDFHALVAAMDAVATGRRLDATRFVAGRLRVLEAFNWRRVAHELAELVTGRTEPAPAGIPLEADAETITAQPRQIHQNDVLDVVKMLRPWSMARTQKVRVGNRYDGGYVVPEMALDCDGVLSIGVGPDVSFDMQLAERGARILQFDHTVEQPPSAHANFTFYKLGWGARSEGDFLSFADICAKLLPLGVARPLLKFDIEGAEYEVFEALDPDMLRQFEVIACEIHDLEKLGDAAFFDKARRVLEKLTRHHVPVHLHANNYAGVAIVQGVPFPQVLEISFLRRDLDSFPELSREAIPGVLDRPNHPFAPDICMNPF